MGHDSIASYKIYRHTARLREEDFAQAHVAKQVGMRLCGIVISCVAFMGAAAADIVMTFLPGERSSSGHVRALFP